MNPNDVFPRRNLPGTAEEWGREVEQRIIANERQALVIQGNAKSNNRTSASTLGEIARQVEALRTAYGLIPKPAQTSTTSSGWGLGAGWNNVLSASLVVPSGTSHVNLLAIGSGFAVTNTSTALIGMSCRLTFNGVGSSPDAPGAWYTGSGDYRTAVNPTYSWSANVTAGSTLTVYFQLWPEDPGAYPANANSYAALSLLATFTA